MNRQSLRLRQPLSALCLGANAVIRLLLPLTGSCQARHRNSVFLYRCSLFLPLITGFKKFPYFFFVSWVICLDNFLSFILFSVIFLFIVCRENSPVHYHVRIADIVQNIVKGQIVAFCKTAYDSPNAVI